VVATDGVRGAGQLAEAAAFRLRHITEPSVADRVALQPNVIAYLTFGDSPCGIYWSQVTDVVKHLRTLTPARVRLIAFVSGRVIRTAAAEIKSRLPDAIVLPHAPSVRRWKWNRGVLAGVLFLLRPTGVICRGAFATALGLDMRRWGLVRRVCFDARGAYAAESREFLTPDDPSMINEMRTLEGRAIADSDARLAVSRALVQHWRTEYGYRLNDHVVIPCTLSDAAASGARHAAPLNGRGDGTRAVFSGSIAGWHSFGKFVPLLEDALISQPDLRVLFLSKPDATVNGLCERHPTRVERRWLAPTSVPHELAQCDVGVLIRDNSMTNRVASPVKFGEYLAAGLRVVISEGLGDVSDDVAQCGLGWVWKEGSPLPRLEQPTDADRVRLREYVLKRWVKAAYDDEYRVILSALA